VNEQQIEQMEREADQLLSDMTKTDAGSAQETDPTKSATANADDKADSQNGSGEVNQDKAPEASDSANPQSEEPKELSPLEKRLKDTQEFAHRKSMENAELAKRLTELEQKLADGSGEQANSDKSINSLEDLKAEFPELVDPLISQLTTMQNQIQQISGKVSNVEQTATAATHEQQILSRHPNFQRDVTTPEFGAWLQANPHFQQTAQAGTAQDVVYMLNEFYATQQTPASAHEKMLEQARQDADPQVRSQPTDPSQNAPKFTLAQVSAMSMEEYEKHEAEIDQLIATGQLR
jgi:hypothetical protein